MSFRDSLRRSGHRDADKHRVRTQSRVFRGETDEQPEFGDGRSVNPALEVRTFSRIDAEALAAGGESLGGSVVAALDKADGDRPADVRRSAVGHAYPRHIAVTRIEMPRLHHCNLDRQAHLHLAPEGGVAHRLVVGEKLHIISRELVRVAETEADLAVLVGTQERLPGYRVREILAYISAGRHLFPGCDRA